LLSRPYAFGCVLRLRTSSDFEPGNSVSSQATYVQSTPCTHVASSNSPIILTVWAFLP